MVIAHFANNDGGVGTVIYKLANQQVRDGNIVYVFTTNMNFSFLKKLDTRVKVLHVKKNYKLPPMLFGNKINKAYKYLKRKYENEKIILHAHNFITIGVLSRIKGLPLLCTIHGISSINNKKTNKFFQEKAISLIINKMKKNSQLIVAVSEHTSKYYGELSNKDLITIHNGTSNKVPLKKNDKYFTFAHLGDISINKGWVKELEAFSLLRKKYPDEKIKFVFAGKLVHMTDNDVNNMINHFDLNKNDVQYLGFINDIQKELLSFSNVMMLISKSEGLPMTLIEAQEMGIPVIATSVGGIPEIIVNNKNGFLVSENVNDIFEKMETLMLDNDKYRNMCRNSLNYYKNNFTLELMVSKYYRLYEELK